MRISVSTTLKLAAAAGVLAIGSLAFAAPAQAAKYSNPTAAAQHYADCARWLFSDPAQHAANCNPGHTFFVSSSTGYGNPAVSSPCPDPCKDPCIKVHCWQPCVPVNCNEGRVTLRLRG